MEFVVATPLQQQVQFTEVASEAGSAGSRRSEAEGLQGRLDAANASIAQLSLQLGEARAQLAAAAELREMSVKFAVLEARLAAQDEIKELEAIVASMRLEWAQWGAPREAELLKEEAELLMGAPGLAEPTAPTASQAASVPAAQTGIPGAMASAPEGPGAVQAASTSGLTAPQAADTMVDAWALSRAAAGATAPSGTQYGVQVREAADQQHVPLKDLHPKDIPPPAPYKGDCASWLEWSGKFRRYALSRSNRSITQLLEKIELLRGNPVTPGDETAWELGLHFVPSITEYKERLHTLLEACTTGPAGLIVTQCGVGRICDAWRQLADAGCSLREDNVLNLLSKIMTARSHVPDKELQGYMTKWERDLEFYAKATGGEAVTPAQHKMFLLRMCSVGLHTHLGYTKATEGTLATIRQEIANWLHRTQPQGKGGGFAALEEAQLADTGAEYEEGDFDVGPEATQRLLEEDPSGALLAVVKKGLKDNKSGGKG